MSQEKLTDTSIERLIEILSLEMIEKNIFRGESQDIGSPQVFGGQVLGRHSWQHLQQSKTAWFIPCMPTFLEEGILRRQV